MQIMSEIQDRRSIRKYKNMEIKDEEIYQIIKAAILAPSGSNTQPWKFIVIKNQNVKKKIVKADHDQKWMLSAPIFIACLANMESRIENPQSMNLTEESINPELKLIIRDTAIAISYLMLEAQHLGLGTCWTGWYDQEKMRKILEVPSSMYVSGIITLGYSDETPKQRPRKAMNEVLEFRC